MDETTEWYDYKHICPKCGHLMEKGVDVYEFWGREESVVTYECPHCGHCEQE